MATKKTKSSYSKWTRALALAMAILVASGVVVYLVTFLINLFS